MKLKAAVVKDNVIIGTQAVFSNRENVGLAKNMVHGLGRWALIIPTLVPHSLRGLGVLEERSATRETGPRLGLRSGELQVTGVDNFCGRDVALGAAGAACAPMSSPCLYDMF